MIAHASIGDRGSVAAAVSTAAIAAVAGIASSTDVTGTVVLARPGIGLTAGVAGGPIEDCQRRRDDRNHPDDYLAHILAPSAVDTLKGNRR